jgi:beta-lactamase class A
MLSRRAFVVAGAALAVPARAELPVMAQLAALEAKAGGRLGVQAINTQGRVLGAYRFNQRFAFCSAFKLTLAALVLLGGEKGKWRVDERLAYGAADLLPNSPVTKRIWPRAA